MCFLFGKKKILAKQKELSDKVDFLTNELRQMDKSLKEMMVTAISTSNTSLQAGVKNTLDAVVGRVGDSLVNNEKRIAEMRVSLDKNLGEIRENNEKRLTEMRAVVEEKLTTTLSERLTATVTEINTRLDAVNKNLGEMQSLTNGVTDLKKMLSNVKTRGVFGETSLQNILDNVFTTEQYCTQFNLGKPGDSRKMVDFAVVMPGKKGDEKVYLPIDAKFPLEDYHRLVDYSDKGDIIGISEAKKALLNAIKQQAKSISANYIIPPKTVDFALMYLPIEGLYAEVVRDSTLLDELSRKYKVIPVGPTTITALLNSLQLGFRTLAVQKSSKEIFDLLTKFRGDFAKFALDIDNAQRQLNTASRTLDETSKRTSIIMKKLDKVENMAPPEENAINGNVE